MTDNKTTRLLLALACLLGLTTATAQQYEQLTDVPSMYVETFNHRSVTSKSNYVYCKLTIVDGADTLVYDSTQIRGRGNSSWGAAKKPYRIKFNHKQRLLGKGFANAKSWTLLANHGDKTMIRNALTYDLGRFIGLPFCPAARFVDLYMNGTYRGTYQISDQVQVKKRRVDIDEERGWLIEVTNNNAVESPYFRTTRGIMYNVKNPDDENLTNERLAEIRQWVQNLESLVFSEGYADPETGYRAYMDEQTLIDWYVGAELTGNIDALYSIYMYKDAEEPRLHFGPLWDLDIGYDNSSERSLLENMEAYLYLNDRPYEKVLRRLWEDPWFARACHERLEGLVASGLQQYLQDHIDSLRTAIYQSQEQNFKVWNIRQQVYSFEKHRYHGTYDEYVDDLRNFIDVHISYLQEAFASRYATADVDAVRADATLAPKVVHNLQGQRVVVPRRGGIYVKDGKKFVCQ